MVGSMGGSVGQWVGSGHVTKYRINLDLTKIIKFCLKIYDLLDTCTYGWVYRSVGWVRSNDYFNKASTYQYNLILFEDL